MIRQAPLRPGTDQLAVGEQEEFSGCPGDSGSGVYWAYEEDGPHLEVVGVTSYINLFRTVFARLDGEVENGVHQCLRAFLNDPEAGSSCLHVYDR